jgi:asparaginyl-tRNA synthetase
MLPKFLEKEILKDEKDLEAMQGSCSFKMPNYNPKTHYKHITDKKYFHALTVLRHYIKAASDYYFGVKLNAKNIDLFMLTSSISSPMGPGSDSEPIRIKFGKYETCLVDSSQFGFEPLLMNGFSKVYCYLPSMRGEDSDKRHLNQFYHCEMEMKGTLDELISYIEGYIKVLCEVVLLMDKTTRCISGDYKQTRKIFKKTLNLRSFPSITFDKAVDLIVKHGMKKHVRFTKHGRDITSQGEKELMRLLKADTPIWVKYYDRDRVPFYQKPDPKHPDKTLNADLLFPPIIKGSFGGEIVGSGQRQDNPKEMYESLKRQNDISADVYEWYIDLRKSPAYQVTSGFGLGIERFIAWALAKDDIRHVILYPRIKNTISIP